MTFLIIIGIVAFLLAILNRAARNPYTYIDNDNAKKFGSDRVVNTSVNKELIKEEIKYYYENKNYTMVKSKSYEYLQYYNEDSHLNFLLVISLIELKEFNDAEKYANNVLHKLDNNKTGYYLLGYLEYARGNKQKSIANLKSSLSFGLPKYFIEETIKDETFLNDLYN